MAESVWNEFGKQYPELLPRLRHPFYVAPSVFGATVKIGESPHLISVEIAAPIPSLLPMHRIEGADFSVNSIVYNALFDDSGIYFYEPSQEHSGQIALRMRDYLRSEMRYGGVVNERDFIDVLDKVQSLIDTDADLRRAFLSHSLGTRQADDDRVSDEIAAEVTDLWENRKSDHPGEPWIKNPSKFVAHVYKRWLDAGALQRRHLQHDPALYASYARHIGEKPEDDLGLMVVPTGRKKAKGLPRPKP